MDDRRVTLTLGTTLRFGSLGFVYIGLVEPVAGHTFTRPPRPNVLTGASGARPSSEASRTTSSSACWGQTQHRSVLGSLPTTSPTLPSRPTETHRWAGGVHGAVHRNVPPWTAQPPRRPGDGLRQRPPHDRCCPRVYDDSEGTDRVTSRSHAGVQHLRGHRVEQLRIGASTAPPRRRRPAACAARRTRGGKAPA
jgi:hypothetical protein